MEELNDELNSQNHQWHHHFRDQSNQCETQKSSSKSTPEGSRNAGISLSLFSLDCLRFPRSLQDVSEIVTVVVSAHECEIIECVVLVLVSFADNGLLPAETIDSAGSCFSIFVFHLKY